MTTITAPHAVASPAARIWSVARLNVTNPMTTLILPWIILGSILLMNIAIWALVTYTRRRTTSPTTRSSGTAR